MGRDRSERKHRRTTANPASIAMMAGANFDAVPSLAVAMGTATEAELNPAFAGLTDAEVARLREWGFSGKFPELTDAENNIVFRARLKGFASCFPCFPSAEAQARNTLAAATKWLETR